MNRHGKLLGRIALVYLVFGVAFEMLELAYCNYRANAGQPSDIPCEFLWPVFLVTWPFGALTCITWGYAVLVPSIVVRAVGIVFLGGFIATLAWMLRKRPSPS